MSHTYLLDLYKFLQQQLDKLQLTLTGTDTDQQIRHYTAGRIESVCELERFLKEHYEIKMPRRLRGQVLKKSK